MPGTLRATAFFGRCRISSGTLTLAQPSAARHSRSRGRRLDQWPAKATGPSRRSATSRGHERIHGVRARSISRTRIPPPSRESRRRSPIRTIVGARRPPRENERHQTRLDLLFDRQRSLPRPARRRVRPACCRPSRHCMRPADCTRAIPIPCNCMRSGRRYLGADVVLPAKAARVVAGHDITDIALYMQNLAGRRK